MKDKTSGNLKTIECVVVDYKAHTYNTYPDGQPYNTGDTASFNVPNGIIQTGIAYPNSYNSTKNMSFAHNNIDASVIEFAGSSLDFKISDYTLVKVLVLE